MDRPHASVPFHRGLEEQVSETACNCAAYALDYTLIHPGGVIIWIWELLEIGPGEQLGAIRPKLAQL